MQGFNCFSVLSWEAEYKHSILLSEKNIRTVQYIVFLYLPGLKGVVI